MLIRSVNKTYNLARQISTLNVGNITEEIIERSDYPLSKCHTIIDSKTIGVLGYGPQGRSQSLNLRDNNFNVKLGLRKGKSYDLALEDGWEENINLFSMEEAADKSDIVKYLLSDAGQISQWQNIYPYLTKGKTLYFSHGFGIVFDEKTNILPPDDIDVIMVAPKGAGMMLRRLYKEGSGVNVSYAIHQNATGNAKENCLALAFGIGGNNAYETTFQNETYSDLLGERCVLMGLIQGAFSAQYKVLRQRGHSPIEAYNETVEEALVSLYPLINENGMDWLYSNCSTTAQRGALDWAPIFEKNLYYIIDHCYQNISNGSEVDKVINYNKDTNYREKLNTELKNMRKTELWKVAEKLRKLQD